MGLISRVSSRTYRQNINKSSITLKMSRLLKLPKHLACTLKYQKIALNTSLPNYHFGSHKHTRMNTWDPGFFYEGIDLAPKDTIKNVRNYNFYKYTCGPMSRVRLVDNSQIAIAGMKWYRKPLIIQVTKPNQGLDKGKRDAKGTASTPKKHMLGRTGDLVTIAASHQVAKAVIVGGKQFCADHGFHNRQDALNAVILNSELEPLGNRILVPLPGWLRDCKRMPQGRRIRYNKLFATASKGFY